MTALNAATAPIDTQGVGARVYNRELTRQAVRILEVVADNPNVQQARGSFGALSDNGGTACATQVLYELMDQIREQTDREGALNRVLPVTVSEIIDWNDSEKLSFRAIAAKIRTMAGGALKLFSA